MKKDYDYLDSLTLKHYQTLHSLEYEFITTALKHNNNDMFLAAADLKITVKQLYLRMHILGIN